MPVLNSLLEHKVLGREFKKGLEPEAQARWAIDDPVGALEELERIENQEATTKRAD